jgi:hypothetical protein
MKLMDDKKALEFAKLSWHDAKLIDVRLVRDSDCEQDNLECSVEFGVAGHNWRSAIVAFQDCVTVQIDLDLEGKSLCSDSIFEATCELRRSFRRLREAGQLKKTKRIP